MAYTYTDLTVKLKIDPSWLADSTKVWVALQSVNGEAVEVETTNFSTSTGVITATLTQAQSAKLFGMTYVQANGFLGGERWATEKQTIYVDQNTIRRVVTNE